MRSKRRTGNRVRRALAVALGLALLLGLRLGGWFPGLLPGGGAETDPDRTRLGEEGRREVRLAVLDPVSLSPVEGALVRIGDGDGRARRSGSDGVVRVEDPRAGEAAGTWELLASGSRVELLMSATVAGRVTDSGGRPLAAVVRVVDEDGAQRAEAVADDRGRFGLTVARPPGDVAVLEPGSRLEGRLSGVGTAAALEVYALAPAPGRDGLLELRARWRLDRAGRYAGTLPAGARAWGVVDGRPVALLGGEQSLPERAKARGVVLTPDGAGVPEAALAFRPWLDPVWKAECPAHPATTDAQGRFELGGLARVRYRLVVSAAGRATRILDEITIDEGPLELVLEPGYRVAGLVVDSEGRAVPGVVLHARGLPDATHELPLAKARTGDDGRFVLDGLGGDHAEVWAFPPAAEPWFVGRVEPDDDLRLVLPR